VVHHVDGCDISDGRNRLRVGNPEELVGKVHCLRCDARLGLGSRVGRPKEGVKVELRLAEDVLKRVDAAAVKQGQSRAATLRALITSALGTD
jgi:hypothetical protein